MAGKETKLEEGVISEILAADSNWESDAKASDVEGYFEEEEEEEEEEGEEEEEEEEEEQQQQEQLQASAEVKPQAAKSGWLPTWGPPQGTQTSILLSVQQKVDHEIFFPPSGSNSTQQLDTVTFMWG